MKKLFVAVIVLVLAGLVGMLLQSHKVAEYIRNPYYRDALALEKKYDFIDVIGFGTNERNEVYMGIIFGTAGDITEDDFLAFTANLDSVFQKYVNDDTPLAIIWVVVHGKDGALFANGRYEVSKANLHGEGINNETLRANEDVFYRWIMGTPYRFKEGLWLWVGR